MPSVQDQGLDIISEGLDTLKDLANDMSEVCHIAWSKIMILSEESAYQ